MNEILYGACIQLEAAQSNEQREYSVSWELYDHYTYVLLPLAVHGASLYVRIWRLHAPASDI